MKCIYWGIQYLYVWRRFLKTSKDFSTATLLTGESWVMSGNGSSVWSGFNPWSYLGRPGQQNMLLTSPFLLVFLLVPKLLQQNTNRKYLFQTQKKDMVVYKMTLYKNVLINCDLIRFSWQPTEVSQYHYFHFIKSAIQVQAENRWWSQDSNYMSHALTTILSWNVSFPPSNFTKGLTGHQTQNKSTLGDVRENWPVHYF